MSAPVSTVRHAARVCGAAALSGLSLASAVVGEPLGAQQPTAEHVRAGVSVKPDTVTVGDPFRVRVRIQAPAGTVVTFPTGPDTSGTVSARDPRHVDTTTAPDGMVDVTATYTLTAWDIDTQPLRFGDVQLNVGGADRRVPLGGYTIYVRSVLPADTTLRKPKPPRAPLPDTSSLLIRYWPWILGILAALGLIGWAIYRWWRNRRTTKPADDAYARALAEFARLERMGLIEAGERGRLVALAADVVRDYLSARIVPVAASLTSMELLETLAGHAELPHDRLAALLEHADLVKFAALPVNADMGRAVFAEARALVDEIERAVREREARELIEAEERAKRARDETRRYEEEQRRAAKRRKAA